MNTQRVLMLAYAQYFNDARIKTYVNSLLHAGISVDVICLRDPFSKSIDHANAALNIYFIQNKYQGKSAFRYFISYLLFFLRSFLLVTRNYIRSRYSVIHVHNQPDLLVFCTVIPKIFGSRIILDMHDIMFAAILTKFRGLKQRLLYFIVKLQTIISVSFCDTLICADHSQYIFLKENGISHPTTHIMLNLPDDSFFSRRTYKSDHKELRAIYHGTISHRLGLDLAIQAVELAARIIPISFTIIGNGEQREELESYCKNKSILNSLIYFRDFIPVEYLQPIIEQFDVGIVSNRRTVLGERCMLPVKMMEYLLVGLPVIVPRLPVIQYYFSNDMVSFFEPENITEISQKLVEHKLNIAIAANQLRNAELFFKKFNITNQREEYLHLVAK